METFVVEKINGIDRKIGIWPYPGCPFFPYYVGDRCRIFIIHNVCHNFVWLKEFRKHIRDTDFFYVNHEWYKTKAPTELSVAILNHLGLKQSNFIKMCGDTNEMQTQLFYGYKNSILLPQSTFIDYNLYSILPEKKVYDAILISRAKEFKRLHLANKVKNLALITGSGSDKDTISLPPHVNADNKRLNKEEIIKIINQSKCGLCLSKIEGACWVSSEYLLCGIPVVSTPSLGGRDVWYNEDNSIICQDNEDAVKDAVNQAAISKRFKAEEIRTKHIMLSDYFRKIFIDSTKQIFDRHNVNIDETSHFTKQFRDKWSHLPKGPSIPYTQILEILTK